MTTTTFRTEGRVKVTEGRTYSWITSHIHETVTDEVDGWELCEMNIEVVAEGDDEYYYWEVSGNVLS